MKKSIQLDRSNLVLVAGYVVGGAAAVALLYWFLVPGRVEVEKQYSLQQSASVYDASRVVTAKSFTRHRLLGEFRKFASETCKYKKLGRLMLAPSEKDLDMTGNVYYIIDNIPGTQTHFDSNIANLNPSFLGQGVEPFKAAQVICMGPIATAMIRTGSEVERVLLSGSEDVTEWNVGGNAVSLVGFKISEYPQDSIVAYLRTKTLPTPESALAIRANLEQRTGLKTNILLRTDPFFATEHGPKLDPFEAKIPSTTMEDFAARESIWCFSSDNPRPCERRSATTATIPNGE